MAEFGVRQRWASCVPGFDKVDLVVTDGLLGESDKVFVVGVHVCQFAVDEHDNLIFAPLLLLTNVSRDDTLRLLSQTGVPIHLGGEIHRELSHWPNGTGPYSSGHRNIILCQAKFLAMCQNFVSKLLHRVLV